MIDFIEKSFSRILGSYFFKTGQIWYLGRVNTVHFDFFYIFKIILFSDAIKLINFLLNN